MAGMPEPDPLADINQVLERSAALVNAATPTDEPAADLVAAALVYRDAVLRHPVVFEAGLHRSAPGSGAMTVMIERISSDAGFREAVLGLCEGLAAAELRGELADREAVWAAGLTALVRGWAE